MKSKKQYNGYSLDLEKKIQEFMDTNIISFMYPEDMFVSDMKRMLLTHLANADKNIEVKEIIVVIK